MVKKDICLGCNVEIKWLPFRIKDGVLCNNCYAKYFSSYRITRTFNEILSDYNVLQQEKIFKKETLSYVLPNQSGIKIDTLNKKIHLLTPPREFLKILNQEHTSNTIEYNQILSSEIIQDGSSLYKTNRMSQIGGAALGQILLGPVGLILGGLTGSSRKVDSVTKIDLRIVINDIKNATHIINFLNQKVPITSSTYKNCIALARKWQDHISVIINEADLTDEKVTVNAVPELKKENSIVDELKKLEELKLNGVINEEEFERIKTNLFSKL